MLRGERGARYRNSDRRGDGDVWPAELPAATQPRGVHVELAPEAQVRADDVPPGGNIVQGLVGAHRLVCHEVRADDGG